MRILHVIETLDPDAGGPPAVVLRLAAAQAALGHEVQVASPPLATSRQPAFRASLEGIPLIAKVRFISLSRAETVRWLVGRGGGLPEVDFVHLHGVWSPLILAAAAAARRAGIGYAVAPHGMLDPWSLQQKRWKKRFALAIGWRRMLDHARFLHVLNADEASLLTPLAVRCPSRVIPNGIFLEELLPLPEPGAFRAEFPALADRPYILFLSRLHHKKGLDRLAAGFARVAAEDSEVHLVVAGPDGGAQPEFEAAISAAGLGARTHLTGPIYGRRKYAAMVDCSCFCLPSRQEGFSVAITEALAVGRPVVITPECHFPEVGSVDAGIVTSAEPEPLAAALLELLRDPARSAERGRRGADLVRHRFTWGRIAEATARAYLGGPP
jgi:glycosyltransferase involved in cell wall biosynthesis